MATFVLLEHNQRTAQPPAGVHWDLIVETERAARLPTWQLSADPRAADAPIPVKRLPDHRRHYLTYEGPVSGNRGTVRRIDRGTVHVAAYTGDETQFTVVGDTWRGTYEIARTADGLLLRRVRANQ